MKAHERLEVLPICSLDGLHGGAGIGKARDLRPLFGGVANHVVENKVGDMAVLMAGILHAFDSPLVKSLRVAPYTADPQDVTEDVNGTREY